MNKWKMNRAGLLNFWYYDEEIFTFANGKLLLRGSNGSGKSVTMQSFLPVLLDGKTSPDRLDPFGSRARRMEDYLLGEKEIVDRDERTGYLFIEFKREGTDQYTTVGIGLQAKRNKQMKFWGFIITDNRRIGVDMELYKLENNAGEKQKIPLSRMELENVISDGGHVVQTKSEYMRLVNKYLFGFETIEAYEDLIKLLIQLRSPKLSKDFRPTVIYEILEAALPPLSDEDLRHLSDTIEQMDQTKQQMEQLDREAQAIHSLNQVYHTYNQRILADQANEYVTAYKRLAKEQKLYNEKKDELKKLDQEITLLHDEIGDLNLELETNEKQEERLKSHRIWNLEQERRDEEKKLQQESESLQRKNNQLQDKRQKEAKLRMEINELEGKINEREQEMEDKLLDLNNDAEETSFTDSHEINVQDFKRYQQENFDFSVWNKETNNHIYSLETIEEELRNFEHLKSKYQEKDKELADENKKLDDVMHQEQDWSRLFEEDKEKQLNEIHRWLGDTDWLDIPEEVLQETARAIHRLYEPTLYDAVKEPYRKAVFNYEQKQREIVSRLTFDQKQVAKQLEEKQAELKEWKEKKDPEPSTDPLTKEARNKLQANRITYVPFYAAVEFQENVDENVRKRIEAALIDSGILDALITENSPVIEHDRILTPKPNIMGYTLADYLKPELDADSRLPASLVDDVLRSITIGDEADSTFAVSEEGRYQIGLLQGHALPVTNVRYIGRNARKRFKEEQVQLIQEEIDELNTEKQSLEGQIENVKATIDQATRRLEQFPEDKDLQESFRQITVVRLSIEHHQARIQKLSDEIKLIYREYTQVKHRIDEKTRNYNLEVTLDSYREAITVMKRYGQDLSNLEKEHIQYVNDLNRKADRSGRRDELEQEIVETQGEVNIAEDLIKGLKQNLEQIEIQLEKQGLSDIRQQIIDVQQVLQEINDTLKEKITTKPSKETERNHVKEEIDAKRKWLEFWTNMKETWEGSFKKELERGFIELEKDKDLDEIAKDIVKEFGGLLKEKDQSKLTSQLSQEFYRQLSDLMEYRMNSFTAPDTRLGSSV